MLNPKVSIIIPVYNTEKYVEEAVRSIMEQTLKEIEIIIINDGSTDNSLMIIEKLVNEDRRVQIYSQINKGLSISRNKGLQMAKGKYIYFMDSDDRLDIDALERCYIISEEHQLDLVFFNACILNKTDLNLNINYEHTGCKENNTYTGIQALELLIENHSYTPSVCLHFINSFFLDKIKLSFHPNIIHEDELFTCLLYLQSSRIRYIQSNFFKRRVREDSIMTQRFSLKNMDGYFTVADQLLEYANNVPECRHIVDKHLYNTLNAAAWLSYQLNFRERLYITNQYVTNYWKYVSIKNILILLFKSFVIK